MSLTKARREWNARIEANGIGIQLLAHKIQTMLGILAMSEGLLRALQSHDDPSDDDTVVWTGNMLGHIERQATIKEQCSRLACAKSDLQAVLEMCAHRSTDDNGKED